MLQDLERDRPMEIDALITSVQELGKITNVPTPTIDTVLALTKLRAKEAKLYQFKASLIVSPSFAGDLDI